MLYTLVLFSYLKQICSVKTEPYFRYEGKTRKERNLFIFKITPMNNHING